jgi:hypothetical protein
LIERPTVDVRLWHEGLEWQTKALIDTGSPRTIFDRGAADALEIDLSDRSRQRLHFLAGQSLYAVPAMVALTLPPFDDISWETEVDFLLGDWNMPFGLLGQIGFLDRWVVTFNRYRNYFAVQQIDDFEERLPVDPFEEFQKQWDGWDRPG